jgi:hypothetical protein
MREVCSRGRRVAVLGLDREAHIHVPAGPHLAVVVGVVDLDAQGLRFGVQLARATAMEWRIANPMGPALDVSRRRG